MAAVYGRMQDWPLVVSSILDHAENFHSTQEIITHTVEGPYHTYTYADMARRTKLCARVLTEVLGVKKGDVVATMAWNTYRHLELWYAIMGIGAICHTLNPRLFLEQLTYIGNHAEDTFLFVDVDLLPLASKLAPTLQSLKGTIAMTDALHMPTNVNMSAVPSNLHCYEQLLEQVRLDGFQWPLLDEQTAAGICYTSGTTGNPKGVVYSHRSNTLHGMACIAADCFNLKAVDRVLPVVPMFHANAWGLAFSTLMAGCKLVLPGPLLDGPNIHHLLETYKVTFTAAVPTVWLALLDYMNTQKLKLSTLQSVCIGGSAVPRKVLETFKAQYGVEVKHAWGMTELSPMGSVFGHTTASINMSERQQVDLMLKQGRPFFGLQMKIVDDDGNILPRDGKSFGHLMVKGPAVAKSYLKGEGGEILDKEGWFDTGDVATLDEAGFMNITDRSKDVIKSGGEWISSIEVENAAVSHPQVAEACVIGLEHPKWGERPLLLIVKQNGGDVTKDSVLHFIAKGGKIAKWWIPDDVQFVKEIAHTATGKIDKKAMRIQFKDYTFPVTPKAKL
mmetsp:Transcript_38502/g.46498  ORF Transcript_38502/g.46498 Transcript_38502/m.46498 type:complete len:560 (-) Transcript_38502:176-1855(-)